jgi:hypothetical protein
MPSGQSHARELKKTMRIFNVRAALVALCFVTFATVVVARVASASEQAAQPVTGPQLATPAAPPATPASQPSASPTPSETPLVPTGRRLSTFRVVAKRIAFYSNRYVMEADGNVVVTLGDGTRIAGNTFFYDLRLSRFVIAGDVRLSAAGRTIDGAAFAEYFDFDRAYFVPILSQPDRWTFASGDYAHPLFGREMPGDAFFLPDLSGERVFLYAKVALADPRRSVRFTPATINFGLTFVPFPSYFLNYSPNEYFAENALNGAFADGPLDFAGGQHSLATAHIRYDSLNKVYPALELHQVSANSYIVVSANPLTRPLKTYNLQVYDRITPTTQFQAFVQETAFQRGFSQPLSATAFANYQLTQALPHSFLQLSDVQYYQSLLARPSTFIIGPGGVPSYYYGDPSHNFIPDHPNTVALSWIGFRHQIHDVPISFQLRSSYGATTNTFTPIQDFGGVAYTKEFYKSLGINLTTKNFTLLADPRGRHRDLYFTAGFDKQRQWFSLPHFIDTTIVNGSLTKVFNTHVTLVANYTNVNTGDFYGARQTLAYPPGASYYNYFTGQTIEISPGFRGFGTTRSFAQSLVYTPSQTLSLNLTMRENDDFPKPLPGTIQIVGDGLGFVNYGVTPYQFDVDVRYRFTRVLVVDISRSYFFNFAGLERWTPQFNVLIEK